MLLKRIFQQDNVAKHISKLVNEWFRVNGLKFVTWPYYSINLNPIKHLWGDVKKWLCFKMLVALSLNKVSCFIMQLYKTYTMYFILICRQCVTLHIYIIYTHTVVEQHTNFVLIHFGRHPICCWETTFKFRRNMHHSALWASLNSFKET